MISVEYFSFNMGNIVFHIFWVVLDFAIRTSSVKETWNNSQKQKKEMFPTFQPNIQEDFYFTKSKNWISIIMPKWSLSLKLTLK